MRLTNLTDLMLCLALLELGGITINPCSTDAIEYAITIYLDNRSKAQ